VTAIVKGPGIEGELSARVEKFGTPLYLDGLRNGTYEVKVELRGADDKVIPGLWNTTTRTIGIDHDAPSDPVAAHGGHDPSKDADAGAAPAKPPAPKAAPPAPKAAPPKAAPAPKK
jgi:hypothetical protein